MRIIILFLTSCIFFNCSNKSKEDAANKIPVSYFSTPAKSPSSVPYLFTDKNGIVYLSWVEKNEKESLFKFSRLQGKSWSEPELIASGNSWFVNWADYPMIATDGDKNFISHVLDKSGEGAYSYDVKMFTSADEGDSWSNSFILHNDGKEAEHGFVTMVPYQDKIFVSWLDGRNTAVEGNQHGADHHGGHHGAMTLRAAIIDYTGKKINEWELDSKVCDCCQTTAVITDNGPVVIYRDRSDDEIRDMSVVRLIDGNWTEPRPVYRDNWKISGCPVNGPRASAIGNNMSVAWFSAPGGEPRVNVVFSRDGGQTFSDPVRVDESKANGRVDIIQLDANSCMVSWMEEGNIRAVKVNDDGSKDPAVTIASSSEARSSGFPQMTKGGNELIFAWTDDKEKIIKAASLSLQ